MKNAIILILLIVLSLLILFPKRFLKEEDIINIKDSTVIEYHSIDTFIFDTIPVKIKIENIYYDTIIFVDTILNDSIKAFDYNNPIEDSLISGNINTIINTDGLMLTQKLTYTPKFPKYIIKTDSIIINKKETIKYKPKFKLYGGVDFLNTNERSYLLPSVLLERNNKIFNVSYNYNKKQTIIGCKLLLYKK